MSLSDWAVLAALAERPTHGFRLAALFAKRGELGTVWTIQRPQVYRALEHVGARAFTEASGTELGNSGPPRLRYAVTRKGQEAANDWFQTPVTHLRDARSELLLKLVFLERSGANPEPLLKAQLELFRRVQRDYETRLAASSGAERLALEWRLETIQAALRFLERRCDSGHDSLRLFK